VVCSFPEKLRSVIRWDWGRELLFDFGLDMVNAFISSGFFVLSFFTIPERHFLSLAELDCSMAQHKG